MVKPPKTRHSQARRDPMTIDLGPEAVSRISEGSPDSPADVASAPTEAADDQAGIRPDEAPAAAAAEEAGRAAAEDEALPEAAATAADAAPRDPESRFGRGSFDPSPPFEPEIASPSVAASPAEDAPRETPSPAPRRTTATASSLVAGLIGGLAALLVAGLLAYAGWLPGTGAGTAQPAGQPNGAGLEDQLAALENRVATLQSGAGDPQGAARSIADLGSRLDGLAAELGQTKADLASVRSSIEAGGAGDNAGLKALGDRLAKLERTDASAGPASAVPAAVDEKLGAMDTALKAASDAAAADDGRIAGLEKGLATVEQGLADLSSKLAAQAAQPKAALAIAAAGLKSALDDAGTFTAEVETFAAVAPDSPELAALRDVAAAGVPSRGDLVAAVPAAADAMIEAGQPVAADSGIFSRLLASARSLVKVRPVGPVAGSGVPETVARLAAAIEAGDLQRATAEYDSLPDAPKAAGAAFMDKVRARLKAEELVEKAAAGALKA